MSGGAAANDAGKTFEYVVASVLESQSLPYQSQKRTTFEDEYGYQVKVDFYVPFATDYPDGFYVECRWQESSGSADKKNNALADAIVHCYDRPTFIVCGGSEIDRAYEVLVGKCRYHGGNLRGVFRLEQFVAFAPSLRVGGSVAKLKDHFDPQQRKLFA